MAKWESIKQVKSWAGAGNEARLKMFCFPLLENVELLEVI